MTAAIDSVDCIVTENPATGETAGRYEVFSGEQIDARLGEAHRAFLLWRETPLEHRCELLRSLAAHFRTKAAGYARTIVLEMGKTVAEAEAEVEKCAWACDYYAENAPEHLARRDVQTHTLRRLRRVQAARRGARRHAVEFSVLSSRSLRGPGSDCRQCRRSETRR